MACEGPTTNANEKADSDEQAFADLNDFTADTFASYMSDRFTVQPDGNGQVVKGNVELQLMEIGRFEKLQQLEGSFENRPRAPFSLLFRCSHEAAFPGGVWTVQHRELGMFQLFLNPVQVSSEFPADHNPDGMFYESVFN